MPDQHSGAKGGSGLPLGLQETIDAFLAGCKAKDTPVAGDVPERIVGKFRDVYAANASEWPDAELQVLTIAGLCGRLAALYAQVDGSTTVQWVHARHGLSDGQAECQTMFGRVNRGKHCKGVDLEHP